MIKFISNALQCIDPSASTSVNAGRKLLTDLCIFEFNFITGISSYLTHMLVTAGFVPGQVYKPYVRDIGALNGHLCKPYVRDNGISR
jgi:hypothetical protein